MQRFASRMLRAIRNRIEPYHPLPVFHHAAFRLPRAIEHLGLEPRRADLALWALHEVARRRRLDERTPPVATWTALARVHTPAHLEAITRPTSLAAMFGVDSTEFPVDQVLASVRLATGATIAAARLAVERKGPVLNLFGGFHHASPGGGGGFCVVNDIAVAVAAVRADGLVGTIVILDLDAHPPDGTAACLADQQDVWIGSLSGVDWGPLEGVDETVLPPGCTDETYLDALDALLGRAPRNPVLTLVLAGGDVLHKDKHGTLGLSLSGARKRDRRVHSWLGTRASVWVPAGGYHANAWRVLAATGAILAGASSWRMSRLDDPMVSHYARIARTLTAEELSGADEEDWFSPGEMDGMFGGPARAKHFLGYYTAQGIEHGLYAYGIFEHLQRLGYRDFHIEIDGSDTGDRFRLRGQARGERHTLVSSILKRETHGEYTLLYVEWLNLRHPIEPFTERRPALPGQDVPGLGLSWEAGALFVRMAERLDLDGMAWRPAWFHVAWIARHRCTFLDEEVQAAFEALHRDLGHVGLSALTRAVADDRVLCNGETWVWDAAIMVSFVDNPPTRDANGVRHRPRMEDDWESRVAHLQEAMTFTLV